ncbi:MAG: two pore domain potassium channel family protein [Acidimicrobiia bacterium]|nr:two pore domain potassium channel family protein [Acidimicrobiia bacterium]
MVVADEGTPMIDDVIGGRAAAARHRFEAPVLGAALLVIPVVFIEEYSTTAWLLTAAGVANWLIWAAFAAEFAVVVSLAQNRAAYAQKAWLDLVIIVISFPVLPELLALTRLSRLARLSRLLRTLRVVPILVRGFNALGRLFKKRGFGYVTLVFLLVALTTGALFALFEETSLLDGLWWTVVTLTTVGYGDLSPATPGGRATAVVLMVTSIGVVSFITANIAAFFIEEDEDDNPADEVRSLHQRLDRIEELLTDRGVRPPDEPSR